MKDKISTYLQKLKFRQKDKESVVYKYLNNLRYTTLFIILIIPIGILSFINLPRQLNPDVNIPFVQVTTILPGASSSEVESLVTIPIENSLKSIGGIESIESVSQKSSSIISVEFSSSTDIKTAKQEAKDAIEGLTGLPEDADGPNINEISIDDSPIVTYAMFGKTQAELFENSREINKLLEAQSFVDRVQNKGLAEEKIVIKLQNETLQNFQLNIFDIQEKILQSTKSYPAGDVFSSEFIYPVTLEKQTNGIDEIGKLPIHISEGKIINLHDIAEIKQTNESETKSFLLKEKEFVPVVVFEIYKTQSADITKSAKEVQEIVNEFSEKNNVDFELISSTAKDIEKQFSDLSENFLITLLLVFITLFLFLGVRQSAIVALSIPLTFLITFSAMSFLGISLNFLTVFSLLLALGLLVDDAIVIVSSLTSYTKNTKFSAAQSGFLVFRDFIVPIWTTTLTTVWAFLPLLLASGIIGEFIKTIPIVVSTTLIASTAVATLITLPFTIFLLNKNSMAKNLIAVFKKTKYLVFIVLLALYFSTVPKQPFYLFALSFISYFILLILLYKKVDLFTKFYKRQAVSKVFLNGVIDSDKLAFSYKKLIKKLLVSRPAKTKTILAVVAFFIFSYALVPLGLVKTEFFPKTDSNTLFVNVQTPKGTRDDITQKETKKIAQVIPKEAGIQSVLIDVNKNEGVITLRIDEEILSSTNLAEKLRKMFTYYTKAKIEVQEISEGPPVGADVEISITGEDLRVLEEKSDKLVDFLNSQPGVVSTEKSIEPSVSQITFKPDKKALAARNTSLAEIGGLLRTYLTGNTLSNIQLADDKEVDIVFQTGEKETDISKLYKIQIPTSQGYVPISALGEFVVENNPERIERLDGKRKITVRASVDSQTSSLEINKAAEEFIETLNLDQGYQVVSGGVNEENQRSVNSILQAMILSVVLILATMVVQLGSYRKAVIVILVIPLAISGVFLLFAITNTPLSFPALIGILALFGIVVNNSIMLVEKINQNIRFKLEFNEAIADAAANRVQPILFSSLTTIVGLAPITITDPLWRGLGGAIIAGLTFSGASMLIFIPLVYSSIFGRKTDKS